MGKLMLYKVDTLKYKLLCFLFVFMPFQYYVCTLFLDNIKIDNLFRDFVLITILLLTIFDSYRESNSHFRIDRLSLSVVVCIIGLVISALLTMIFKPNSEELSRLRLYVSPILIFFVTSNIRINKDQYNKLNRMQFLLFALIAVYGVFQAFVLGSSFLIKLGYKATASGMYLDGTAYYITGLHGLQRVVALYNSPNLAGSLFAMFLCLLVTYRGKKNIYLYIFEIVSLSIGLIGTFSRSAIIGLVAAMFFVFIFNKKSKISANAVSVFLTIFILLSLVFVLVVLSSKGIFSKMINYILKITISGDDHSLQKHITDLYEPIKIVLENPLGRGFGDNGPIAIHTDSTSSINVESSIYLMIFEEGIFFGVLFFVPYIIAIIRGLKSKKGLLFGVSCICIVFMLQYLVLPTVQTYEMLFYSFAYIGFSNNLYLNSDFEINTGF